MGQHQLKFGVDYRPPFPRFAFRRYVQQIQFNDKASVLAGRASSVAVQANNRPTDPLIHQLSAFAQDTLKATRD